MFGGHRALSSVGLEDAERKPRLPLARRDEIRLAEPFGLLGLAAFFWSMKSGQFEDLEGAAVRVLFDDDLPK